MTNQSLYITICGALGRDPESLRIAFSTFNNPQVGRVLSPQSIEFVKEAEGIAYVKGEERSPLTIERQHLEAIDASDIVWLHAPYGYVGRSGAFEIGYAHKANIPIFTLEKYWDRIDYPIRHFVQPVMTEFFAVRKTREILGER